jgi:uncharacterized protein
MFIDIKDIATEGKRVTGDLNLGTLSWQHQETIEVAKASFEAFFRWTEKGLSLKGKAHLSVGLTCSRCLERFYISIEPEFLLNLKEKSEQAKVSDKPVEEDEIDIFPIRDSIIDMKEVLSEQIYLNIPLKPLCMEDCLGLCSVCKGNLNTKNCSCMIEK